VAHLLGAASLHIEHFLVEVYFVEASRAIALHKA
jgi:hypothetical protein